MSNNESDLTLKPLRGKSGKAYVGTYPNGNRVFVKMNTTPILAALAKEQIAPQLLWAKRMANGDVMSAQEWLNGRILNKQDMSSKQIINILLRMHRSRPLVNQLSQLNYRVEKPIDLLADWENNAPEQLRANSFIQFIIHDLRTHLPEFDRDKATIVHGDLRHSNWVITTTGVIYLVDWDSVRLTDRMYDVAYILSHYIPHAHWNEWLSYYGYKKNDLVMSKIAWYGQLSFLMQVLKCYDENDMEHVNQEIYDLRKFREMVGESQ